MKTSQVGTYCLFAICHGVVLLLLLYPFSHTESSVLFFDKFVHICLFMVLTMITILFLGGRWWTTVVGLMGYAFLIEVLQDLMGWGRRFEVMDWVVGCVGILGGVVILYLVYHRFTFFLKRPQSRK